MPPTLAGFLNDELKALLGPLVPAASPAGFRALLESFGHTDALAAHDPLRSALAQTATAIDELARIDPAQLDTWDGVVRTLTAGANAFAAVRALERAITDPALAARAKGLGAQLVGRLVALHLRSSHPLVHTGASLLTLIDPAEAATPSPLVVAGAEIVRLPWVDDAFHVERAGDLIARPWQTLGTFYLANQLTRAADAFATADRLFPLLVAAARAIGLHSYRDIVDLDPPGPLPDDDAPSGDHFSNALPEDESTAPAIDPAAALVRHMPRVSATLRAADERALLGISLVASSAEHDGGIAGVTATVAGRLDWSEVVGDWQVTASSDGEIPAFVFGPNGLALAPASTGSATGRLRVTRISDGGPAFTIGSSSGSRLELGAVSVGIDVVLQSNRRAFSLTVDVDRAKLVIAPADGDGFLRQILPAEGVTLECGVGLSLSTDRGLDIGVTVPGATLSGVVPVGRSIGPVRIDSLSRDFRPVTTDNGSGLAMTIGVRVAAKLGPVEVSLDGPSVGAAVLWSLSDATKTPNLGVVHLDGPGLRPPTGVGLSIDSSVAQGAGFLAHDPARHLYAGAALLTVRDRFSLEIAGLLTTRMPDGSDGYSLLLLGILQFPPIPIGFGFSINQLGVLVGINRTANVDALTGALAAGDLDVVLFPRNPTALPAVPDALGKLFPPKADAHVIGIIAGFTWGPSALATIELGIIYDTSAPARLVAIGRLTIERPQIVLHVLALGVLDLNEGELDLQARLFDSRVLGGDLSGGAALMVRWGDRPDLVLSIGGFHPAYTPPTAFTRRFAALSRVTLRAHTDESMLRLALQAYLAVTSNTVQMGARVDFGVTVSAFSIDGMVSFDALVQWDPAFYIDVAVRGSVALKIGGTTLVGASVAAQLVGPGDWYVDGKATLTILWWDVDYRFTIGARPAPPVRPAVDGVTQLVAALTDARSWGAQVVKQGLVSVRRPSASSGPLVLHPLDDLTVRQQVVPLGFAVDRIEAGPLTASRTFDVTVTIGGRPTATEALTDAFARAQYVNLSDAAKLAAPSFEALPSGVRVHLAAATAAPAVATGWTYDQFLLTGSGLRASSAASFAPDVAAVAQALTTSAAADAPLRQSTDTRYDSGLELSAMVAAISGVQA